MGRVSLIVQRPTGTNPRFGDFEGFHSRKTTQAHRVAANVREEESPSIRAQGFQGRFRPRGALKEKPLRGRPAGIFTLKACVVCVSNSSKMAGEERNHKDDGNGNADQPKKS